VKKGIVIHRLGTNTLIVASASSIIYKYMYSRTIYNGNSEFACTNITMSDDFYSLLILSQEEIKNYKLA
jgi:hypothetical protein